MIDTNASQRIERLMPLADAIMRIERRVEPLAPRRIARGAAFRRTLAAPVTVASALPPTAIALRDGVAVRAEATLDASSYAPVPVEATPVETGDPLPAGADAVVPTDAIEMRGTAIHVVAPVASGDGVLPADGDVAAGELILRRVTRRLRAVDLAAAAALGLTELEARAPRIRIAAANCARSPVIGAIMELLARAVEGMAGTVVTEAAGGSSLDGAFDDADSDGVILVGGSGTGRRDRAVRELARRGKVEFHGVGLTPGETAAFGMVGKRPVLVVPGRLDAALAVWLTLGRTMLLQLAGCKENEPSLSGILAHKITSTLGLAELVPVARHGEQLKPLAFVYLPLHALTSADGCVLVPADSEGFPAGTQVETRPLP
jgi:molybdopterin biosynthesis enzyme